MAESRPIQCHFKYVWVTKTNNWPGSDSWPPTGVTREIINNTLVYSNDMTTADAAAWLPTILYIQCTARYTKWYDTTHTIFYSASKQLTEDGFSDYAVQKTIKN